jgi:hypothetical protein
MPAAQPQRRGRPLHFVTFHADLSRTDESAHPHTELAQRQYVRMIEMLFVSARRAHPKSRCTVLTTRGTNLDDLPKWINRVDCEAGADTLMRDRMAAQISFLDLDSFDLPMVLIDSDVLVTRPLSDVFAQDFDVGLTWREVDTMPFNGGVLFLNNVRPDAVRSFFKAVFDIYNARHLHRSKWFGDQTAIAEFVGLGVEQVAAAPQVTKEGVRVLFLPCETYNYSPENEMSAIRTPLGDKAILHFKGARKALMHCYFDAYLGFFARPSIRTLMRRRKARLALKAALPVAAPDQAQPA